MRYRVAPLPAALVGAVTLLLTVASLCWAASTGLQLLLNGKVASTGVRVIDGRAYVPVDDVARALGLQVTKTKGAYLLATAGGANQVQGARQGKIGSELFTGKWRFQVTGVQQAESYVERYYQEKRTIKPRNPGETLIIVTCRLKNGLTKTQSPLVTERMPANTALADDLGQSYSPLDYDARQQSDKIGSYEGAPLLPGAGMDLALLFSVPAGTKAKALVFTLSTYPDDVGATVHGTDVRISLAP